GTRGAGGHATRILERALPGGRLLGIEADPEMAALAERKLSSYGEAVTVVVANFREAGRVIDAAGFAGLDAALFDLGLNSLQLDTPSRGFSLKADGPLDMRFDRSRGRSASEVLSEIDPAALERAIAEFGEERFARRIAAAIVAARSRKRITSTLELRELVCRALPGVPKAGSIDPATRTFQA